MASPLPPGVAEEQALEQEAIAFLRSIGRQATAEEVTAYLRYGPGVFSPARPADPVFAPQPTQPAPAPTPASQPTGSFAPLPYTPPTGGFGGGGSDVDRMRRELAAHDPVWWSASDAQVVAEYSKQSGAAGGGFGGGFGFTATGGMAQAQLEATLAQQAAQLELERQRLFGRDIPQLVGQAVSPLDLQDARIKVWEASGRDDFWLQAPPTRVVAEFLGLTANDLTQTELRNRLQRGVPTLEREEFEGQQALQQGALTGVFEGEPTLDKQRFQQQQLLDFARMVGDPRSLIPSLQLASAVGLEPGVNFPGLASVLQNQPQGTNAPAFRFNFGGAPTQQGGININEDLARANPGLFQGGQTDQFGFPLLTPSMFGNPQTTTQLGDPARQRVQSIVQSQGRFEPSSFFGRAEQFFPQANVSTKTRTGLTPSTF